MAAQLVIDETTAMARAQDDPVASRRAFLAIGVSVWLCWNAGPSWARCSAAGSATRGRSGWTRCSRPRSWRCWRRSCAARARRPRPFLVVVLAAAGTAALLRALGPV